MQWYRTGDPETTKQRPRGLTEIETFQFFMPTKPPPALSYTEGCWDWKGPISDGYGILKVTIDGHQKIIRAHRTSYKIFVAKIPNDLFVLHSCDRPICVQPAHLHPGSNQQNIDEAKERGLLRIGEEHPRAKLTIENVRYIRKSPLSHKVLANEFNMSKSTIRDIKNRKIWRSLD